MEYGPQTLCFFEKEGEPLPEKLKQVLNCMMQAGELP